jgi:protein-disulfide isomerase
VEQRQAARVVRAQLVKHRRRARLLWISTGTLVLLLIGGLIGWKIYRTQVPEGYPLPAGVTNDGGANGGVVVADEGGPVPVEIYQDFLCPECGQFQATTTATLNQLLADKRIRLIWHPVSARNAQSNPPGYSVRAASAIGCAADAGQNKMKAFGEALFAGAPAVGSAGLNDDQMIDLAGRVGIITPVFARCVRELRYRTWVTNVDATAAKRGVNRLPTVYVNGKLVPFPGPFTLTAAVDSPR